MTGGSYDLRDLATHVGAKRSDSLSRRLAVRIETVQHQFLHGITRATAEEYCAHLKVRPGDVWPGWEGQPTVPGRIDPHPTPAPAPAPAPALTVVPPAPAKAAPLPAGMVFEDPPARVFNMRAVDWPEMLAPLRAYPGRWVRVRTFTGATTAGKYPGRLRRVCPEFEVRSVKLTEGSALYVRFVGEAAT